MGKRVSKIEHLIERITGGKPNNLRIEFNECWSYYQSVGEYLKERGEDLDITFASEQERQDCINRNQLWEVQYYPRTPIGYYRVTKTLKARFEETLRQLKTNPQNIQPIILKAQIDATSSVIEDLKWEIEEYEKREGK